MNNALTPCTITTLKRRGLIEVAAQSYPAGYCVWSGWGWVPAVRAGRVSRCTGLVK